MPDYIFRYLDESGHRREVPVTHLGPELPIGFPQVCKRLQIRSLDTVVEPSEKLEADRPDRLWHVLKRNILLALFAFDKQAITLLIAHCILPI
jgi:hypothetical protein